MAKALAYLIAHGFLRETRNGGGNNCSLQQCCLYRFTHLPVNTNDKIGIKGGAATFDYRQFDPAKLPEKITLTELKELSKKIVGDETNPYQVAQKLYEWVDMNIPWASAREYSTIRNIPVYCIKNMHGDCGIKALTFITLCRLNGIPARWQSGWYFKPPGENSMHDWGMIYFEPYGWMPMDVDFGLRKTDDKKFKWFYLSGMDSYRLIFNDDISQPFWPEKQHVRSETVDSQRGEVEWNGGNLYFDQWSWNMKWELVGQ